MMGIPQDLTVPFTRLKECHECSESFKKGEEKRKIEVFDDPWAEKPRIVAVHSDNEDGHGSCLDKLFDTSWADFRYFACDMCGRIVARQRGDNGWRSHVKELDGEEVCVRCYQEIRLRDGEPAEVFEDGRIPGDFYNSSDLSANDWSLVPGFSGAHITGDDSAARLCAQALKMIKEGRKVLIDYDSMGIGGSEGYVSLYCKA